MECRKEKKIFEIKGGSYSGLYTGHEAWELIEKKTRVVYIVSCFSVTGKRIGKYYTNWYLTTDSGDRELYEISARKISIDIGDGEMYKGDLTFSSYIFFIFFFFPGRVFLEIDFRSLLKKFFYPLGIKLREFGNFFFGVFMV